MRLHHAVEIADSDSQENNRPLAPATKTAGNPPNLRSTKYKVQILQTAPRSIGDYGWRFTFATKTAKN